MSWGGLSMIYTQPERDLLISELTKVNVFDRKYFEWLSDQWPAFFQGRQRTPLALYTELGVLAKTKGVPFCVSSSPYRVRNRSPKERAPSARRRTYLQIESIIQKEVAACTKRISAKVYQLIEELAERNRELSEEVKTLLPYKGLAENHLKKE